MEEILKRFAEKANAESGTLSITIDKSMCYVKYEWGDEEWCAMHTTYLTEKKLKDLLENIEYVQKKLAEN